MSLFINVVSDIKALAKVQDSWDVFVSKHTDNHNFLCRFIEVYAKHWLQGWNLQLIIGQADDRIVGIAPLMTNEKLGMRFATFILAPYDSPDFLIDEQFNTEFVDHVVDYLFETLRCKVVDLTFPAGSKSLVSFQEICRTKRVHFSTEPYMGRRLLKVGGDWEQFVKLKGGIFRRQLKRTERKINGLGSCRVSCFEKEEGGGNTFQKILEVERMSWKEIWRSKRGMNSDLDLAITFEEGERASREIPDFKSTVWLLELDNRPIAYVIVYQYKKTATIVKTSYDLRYRAAYPGVYLINNVLRALFNSGLVGNIDFITDMPFSKNLTDLCLGRVRVLAGKGILPTAALSLYQNRQIRRILRVTASHALLSAAKVFG